MLTAPVVAGHDFNCHSTLHVRTPSDYSYVYMYNFIRIIELISHVVLFRNAEHMFLHRYCWS